MPMTTILRGMAAFHQWTREGMRRRCRIFVAPSKSIPSSLRPMAWPQRCYPLRKASGWMVDAAREAAEAERLARRAAELAWKDALALCTAGFVLAYVAGDLDNGADLIDRALALNPNLAWGWLFSGWVKIWLGDPEVAFEEPARHASEPAQPAAFSNAGCHVVRSLLCRSVCRSAVLGGKGPVSATNSRLCTSCSSGELRHGWTAGASVKGNGATAGARPHIAPFQSQGYQPASQT